ncbi:unnamed protein product [Lathyrus sativus]|nr:unnamed protein product [Lathyrus sativus]
MKLAYSLTLSFLLFVFITNLSIAFSNDDVVEVLDINGAPVIGGNEYHIVTTINGIATRSGLELARTRNSNCDVSILQSYYKPHRMRTSVTFTNLVNKSERILTKTLLNINVGNLPYCADSSEWLLYFDYNIYQACVGIGGYKNYNNSPILTAKFGIWKHGFGYKFKVITAGSSTYLDIGRLYQQIGEGGHRLYMAGDVEDPYEFILVPAFIKTEKSVV